jgi:osmoprotectant transport system permease protein
MDWSWIPSHASFLLSLMGRNLYLALVPVVLGLILSLPLGVLSVLRGWVYPPVLTATSVIYAIPSLALFVFLIPFTGIVGPTEDLTLIIPLTLYTLSTLVPNVVDGLRSVPEPVRQSATAMGFGTLRRLVEVELPIATPIIIAGLRVATVASISLVSVGQLIGNGALGLLFTDGEQRSFPTEIWAGIALIVILALVADAALVLLRWVLTPWLRTAPRAVRSPRVSRRARALTGGPPV